MSRQRLEWISDGVLAFVLILLALDLTPPRGVGFLDAAPPLFVHAAVFALVTFLWMALHHTLATVEALRPRSLVFNLLALCWLTLMPFAAKVAAAQPLDPLGPSLLAACYGLFSASTVGLQWSSRGPLEEPSAIRRTLRRQGALAGLRLTLAALAWVSPWFGYAALATVFASLFLGGTPQLAADSDVRTGPGEPGALST